MPRRARQLIPRDLPRRTEVLAACALAILAGHLLLAQLTLVLAVVFVVSGKISRWRTWWLAAPAAAGLAWTLAAGPGNAIAGFTAGPSGILRHLAGGHLAGSPLAGFSGAQSWLPRQFPVALVCGAAEAALVGWLDWLHTDEWAVPPPRPGLVAVVRRAIVTRAVRAGAVVTREGCALGVVPATGTVAELRWEEASRGTLIVGAEALGVTLAGLQVVHAALRRRKPVIVLDPGDAALARALRNACLATGTPLLAALPEPADWSAADLGRVVSERSAMLLPVDSDGLAARACADLAALGADLRRIGVDGDALVWAPYGERLPAQALAALLRDGPGAGLTTLIGTTSPTAAAELGGLAGAILMHRVADRDLATSLATRTGTRLLPAPVAAALAGQPPEAGPWPTAPLPPLPTAPGTPVSPGAGMLLTGPVPTAADLVPSPVIPARTLLALGQAEFILAVGWPRRRLIASGWMVPARLPHAADRPRNRR